MGSARVMIVDDDAIVASHIERILSKLGYQITAMAATGEDAIKKAHTDLPEIILMDIRLMGDINGIEAADRIRSSLDIPVIYLTAYADTGLFQEARITEPYAYLTKPVRDKELHAAIEIGLYKHRTDQRVKHLNQVLRAIRDVNQLISQERDHKKLLNEACEILARTRGYVMVWIGQPDQGDNGIFPLTWAGKGGESIGKLTRKLNWRQIKEENASYSTWDSTPMVFQDIEFDPACELWRTEALTQGYASSAMVPMIHGGRLYGILCVYSNKPKAFEGEEVSLLQEVAGDLSLGLRSIDEEEERKQAQKALQESEARFRLLAENSTDIISRHTPDGHFLYVSPACQRLLGYDPKNLIGRSLYDFVHPEDRGVMSSFFGNVSAASDSFRFSYRLQGSAGEHVWFEAIARVIVDESKGAVTEIQISSRDITEQKKAEEEKNTIERQLRQLQKIEALGTLAGGIAHDFNNLLMGIQGYASIMLLEISPNHPNYERLKAIESQVQSGAELTRQLLGFARGGKYEVMPANIGDLLETSSKMFGRTKKEIRIHTKLPKNLFTVEIDKGQIEQVFLNLFVNAWQAMPTGGDLYIEAYNVIFNQSVPELYSLPPGKYVKILVTDTGIGMDAKTRERIFEPFFTTKEMGRGTGLGLASAYGIIKNHGGIIDVESKESSGTTFTIYLPASDKVVEREEESPQKLLRGAETILLVDDQEMVLMAGKGMLEALGYTVFTAMNGREAIRIFREHKNQVDLVVLDMIMPEMSGNQVFEKLREIKLDVRVIISSGYSLNGQAAEMLVSGCEGFIQKPFNIKELSQKLRRIFDG